MRKVVLLLIVGTVFLSFNPAPKKGKVKKSEKFSFVFMTDIHITQQLHAQEGVLKAIDEINKLAPDFVLTGGDNIMDALVQPYDSSIALYNLYEETMENLRMPIYHGMGNHEIFGLYEQSGVSPDHKEYGKKLYEHELAKPYYSFDNKNWRFVVLDGIGFTEDRHYFGKIDAQQIEWLKKDLEKAGNKPVAVSIHIPLLSVGSQIMKGPTVGMEKSTIITNANEIIEILEQHNVKLVLQGHLHFLEDINYNGIHYITGGAVSSNWWKGPRFGMEEGFLKIDVAGEEFDWQYVDFGWEAQGAN